MVNDLMSILLFVTFGNLAKKQKQFIWLFLKAAFFQKVRNVFQNYKSPEKIFQKAILRLKFKLMPANNTLLLLAGNLNLKLRIVFRNICFGDLEI